MLFFNKNYPKKAWAHSNLAVGVAVATVVAVPAHGFIVSSGGLVNATAAATPSGPVEMGWMGSFLSACGWAFMIAAGSLVYQHFVSKWQAKGLPILPMAAMAMPDNNQQRGHAAIPLGSSTANQQRPVQNSQQGQAPAGPPSYLDQYEG